MTVKKLFLDKINQNVKIDIYMYSNKFFVSGWLFLNLKTLSSNTVQKQNKTEQNNKFRVVWYLSKWKIVFMRE